MPACKQHNPATPPRLHRPSLVRQIAEHIRAEIARGAWQDWLPGERELAGRFLVARNTLRAALRELVDSGLVESLHGVGHRVVSAPNPVAEEPRSGVGLLLPNDLGELRPSQILWIDQLRALLIRRGLDLHLHRQSRFPRNPRRHACWVLVLCGEKLQRRFADEGLHCVIAGTPHPGVELPHVDIDHRAVGRHAAGFLISRGHRRLAFLSRQPAHIGDHESELGFDEGVRLSAEPGVVARIIRHDDTRAGVARAVRSLQRVSPPPTALLVSGPHHYLTVHSMIAARSNFGPVLMCRDDDPFLSHLVPAPARYTLPPEVFARHLLKLIFFRSPVSPRGIRLQPLFVPENTSA